MSGSRGGFGTPLDLEDVLGPQHLGHYRQALAGRDPVRPYAPVRQASKRDGNDPELTLWGSGPDQASTCTQLALSPEICWDVCGYYAALGVHWRASRRELMQAYHELSGQENEQLTYVLGQLLDREIRRRYDLAQPWDLFLDDRDVWAAFQDLATRIARRRSAQEGTEVTKSQVLSDLGLETARYGEERPGGPERRDTPATVQKSLDWLEDWSWYTLGMNEPPEDASKLGEWQRLLVAAFAATGRIVRFAVGFHPGSSWQILRVSDGGCIFLIGTEQPSPVLASKAVKGYDAQAHEGEPHMSGFTKGAEAAAEAAASRSGSRIEQLRFDDGTEYFFRVLTDLPELVTMQVHRFIPTKPKPKSWKGDNWPKGMWYGCQNDRAFQVNAGVAGEEPVYEDGYGNCDVHTRFAGQEGQYGKKLDRPETQTFALVVIQKKVDRGGVPGFIDDTEDYTKADGTKVQVPKIRYVAQKWSNFFSPLKSSAYLDGTIRNKIYRVVRTGTEFDVAALGTTPDHAPGTPAWDTYDAAVELMGLNIETMLLDHSSPDFYAKFLIPQDSDSEEPEADGAGSQASGEGTAPEAAGELPQEDLDAMKAKLLGGAAAEPSVPVS